MRSPLLHCWRVLTGTMLLVITIGLAWAFGVLRVMPQFFTAQVGTWSCGSPITDSRDGQDYRTVQIGGQCWMAEDMKIGTIVPVESIQGTDCSVPSNIQKSCTANQDSDCAGCGGLYQWGQAACGSSIPGARGICPSGWHIPTHDEWTTLERAVCTSGTCAADFPFDTTTTGPRGTNEGAVLRSAAGSGFDSCVGQITGPALPRQFSQYITSSQSGATVWMRLLDADEDMISRVTGPQESLFAVRCLRDQESQEASSVSSAALDADAESSDAPSGSSAVCADGDLDMGEECEIGYPCPVDEVCNTDCRCLGSEISALSSSAMAAECGDGVLEGDEQCEENTACPSDLFCQDCMCMPVLYCGDGVVSAEIEEACEVNADCPSGESCAIDCACRPGTGATCGDGALEGLEECERATPCASGVQCNNCLCISPAVCGNAVLERGEQCELHSACPGDFTCDDCQCAPAASCGNGLLEAGEQCETAAQCLAGQTCDDSCACRGEISGTCGNGALDETEQCEFGIPCGDDTKSCNLADCLCEETAAGSACGNAQLNSGEDCDIGNACPDASACNFANCHCVPVPENCGDAVLDSGEQCDIGARCEDGALACDFGNCQCAKPAAGSVCGDGRRDIGEECEVSYPCPLGWGCDYPRCLCLRQAVCGNKILDPGEQCEVNLRCTGANETCDFSRCRCTGQISVCGNGLRDSGEQCDDGGNADGDGCSGICQRERIEMVGSTAVCGDGIVEPPEECDDGNLMSWDGCGSNCFPDDPVGRVTLVNAQGKVIVSRGAATALGAAPDAAAAASGGRSQVASMTLFPAWNHAAVPAAPFAVSGSFVGSGPLAGPVSVIGQMPVERGAWGPQSGAVAAVPVTPFGPAGDTGPASLALMAAGAAAGFAWVRRQKRSRG